MNCPAEMPMKKLDRDRVTFAMVVDNDRAMSGKPGRYMSMEKGPMAESSPSIRMTKNELRFGWDMYVPENHFGKISDSPAKR